MKNRRVKSKKEKESKVIVKNKRTTCITTEAFVDRNDFVFGFGNDGKESNQHSKV